MVDIATWTRLSVDDQSEYQHHSKQFIKAVLQSEAVDGWHFQQLYRVVSDGEYFFISDGSEPFAGIKSRSREVIAALFADAVQNYGK